MTFTQKFLLEDEQRQRWQKDDMVSLNIRLESFRSEKKFQISTKNLIITNFSVIFVTG